MSDPITPFIDMGVMLFLILAGFGVGCVGVGIGTWIHEQAMILRAKRHGARQEWP